MIKFIKVIFNLFMLRSYSMVINYLVMRTVNYIALPFSGSGFLFSYISFR